MRILLLLGATVELILLVVMLRIDSLFLLYFSLLTALVILIIALRLPRASTASEEKALLQEQLDEREYENNNLRGRIGEAQNKSEELESKIKDAKATIRNLIEQIHRTVYALEAEKKLADVINEKTETATIEMTNHIYSIGDWSKKVENLIQDVMGQLNSNEVGLRRQTIDLEEELRRIEKLIDVFKEIKSDYIIELERIGKTMSAVDNFTDTISDLSERTNILAINASIEAARAGQAGRGFAVIASEIQGLAGNTMKIAEEISTTIETSVHAVKDSISNYGERIESAVSRLSKSGEQHATIIEQLGPQIKKVARVAEESGKLSAEVTRNINEVTVHLQYQDSVRQILEHMVQLVESLTRRGTELAESTEGIGEAELERISEEVLNLTKGLFSTREEWKAFGFDLDEGTKAKDVEEIKSGEEGLEGDVTLF